jgi:hypothetical protein
MAQAGGSILTVICPGAGSGVGLSSMTSGCPNSRTTAAFIFPPRDASEPIVRQALRWRSGPRVVTMAELLSVAAFG